MFEIKMLFVIILYNYFKISIFYIIIVIVVIRFLKYLIDIVGV